MSQISVWPQAQKGRNLLGFLVILGSIAHVSAATFMVTSISDSGAGTLRQAVTSVNASSAPARIEFNIPGTGPFVIRLATKLPPITIPVVIDATTQPGYTGTPRIELNGALIAGDGLLLYAGNSTVKGLAITHCSGSGIRLNGGGTNVIQGNFLGTDVTGTNAAGNTAAGLTVYRSSGNTIGGTSAQQRNLISGGNQQGVLFIDAESTSNMLWGNYIGTDITGKKRLGNLGNGVVIGGAPLNQIGGTASGAGNLISGNGQSGIYFYNPGVTGDSTNNLVLGNLIGTDLTGSSSLSNANDGITIIGVSRNYVGGTSPGSRNLISGNGARGILIYTNGATGNVVQGNFIGTDLAGNLAIPNRTNGIVVAGAPGNLIGGTTAGARNVISGNGQVGINVIQAEATNNWICGNYIGLNAAGTKALPNSWGGITVEAPRTVIGGAGAGAGNVISGNVQHGVYLAETGGNYSTVQGNYIGTDPTGKKAFGNGRSGIYVRAWGSMIGGTTAFAGNVISANSNSGIYILGLSASNTVVAGNLIGTDVTGKIGLGNLWSGLSVTNAPAVRIGGVAQGMRNIISANLLNGIDLSGKTAAGATVQGNFIGSDLTGREDLGNASCGIYISGVPSNIIGGAVIGAGNLISANRQGGIYCTYATASNNIIQGNYIGTQADGSSPLGNTQHAIEIDGTSGGNLVGGSTPESENRIAYAKPAGYDGIRIRENCKRNFISRNSIFLNGSSSLDGLGIDAGTNAVTTNGLPTLTAVVSGENTVIRGTMKTVARQNYVLQFYANTVTNISGYGEGMAYIGSQSVTTDASGLVSFTLFLPNAITPGQYVSATATDTNFTTSEFSRPLVAKPVPFLNVAPGMLTVTNSVGGGSSVRMVPGYTLSWPTNVLNFAILETTNLCPPVTWTLLTNVPSLSRGTNQLVLPATNGAHRFYQLRYP